jgi:hypothetical protein
MNQIISLSTPLQMTIATMGPRPAPNGGENEQDRRVWRREYRAMRRLAKALGHPTTTAKVAVATARPSFTMHF